jgi:hypothetical protein
MLDKQKTLGKIGICRVCSGLAHNKSWFCGMFSFGQQQSNKI